MTSRPISRLSFLRLALGLVVAAGWAAAQKAVPQMVPGAPRIGFCLSRDQTVRPLFGLAANLVLGHAVSHGAAQSAFSNMGGLVHVNGQVLLQSIDSGAGSATVTTLGALAVTDTAPVLGVSPSAANNAGGFAGHAAVWLPSMNSVAMWTGAGFATTPVDPLPGPVVSLFPTNAESVALFVQMAGGGVQRVDVNPANGQVLSNTQLDAQATSAFEQGAWTLLGTPAGLTINGANGVSQTLAGIRGPVRFVSVSDDWVEVLSQKDSRVWLLHLDQSAFLGRSLTASELPTPRIVKPRRVAI